MNTRIPPNKGCIEDMQQLAKSRGGKCLSKFYINNHSMYIWQCSKEHIWEMLPLSIRRGSWCPICNKKQPYWLGKKRSPETIKKMTGKFKEGHIPWNKNVKGKEFLRYQKNGKMWHSGKKIPQITGKNHYNWKGGRVIHNGYVRIRCPDHPKSIGKEGYVYEHILVMEKHLGRPLKKGEVVHHINFNKTNNKISNLMLFPSNSAHQKYHGELLRKFKDENIKLKEKIKFLKNKYGE